MDAEKRVITVDRHEWTLKQPAHHTEVEKAVAVANQQRQQLASSGVWAGDVYVSADDEHIIVRFDARRPEKATRGNDATAKPTEAADA